MSRLLVLVVKEFGGPNSFLVGEKECEQLIKTQLHLIVYRQIVHQADKCGFLDELGVFSYVKRLQNPEKW